MSWIHGIAIANAASTGKTRVPSTARASPAPNAPPMTPPYQPNGRSSRDDPSSSCAHSAAPTSAHDATSTTAARWSRPAAMPAISTPTPAAPAAHTPYAMTRTGPIRHALHPLANRSQNRSTPAQTRSYRLSGKKSATAAARSASVCIPVVIELATIASAHVQPIHAHAPRRVERALARHTSAANSAHNTWKAGNADTPAECACSAASNLPNADAGTKGRLAAATGTTSHTSVTTQVAMTPWIANRRSARCVRAMSTVRGTNTYALTYSASVPCHTGHLVSNGSAVLNASGARPSA